VSMSIKDSLRGREPRVIGAYRDIMDGNLLSERVGRVTWAAVIQGGAMGMFGDVAMGFTSQYGNRSLSQVLGPVMGTGADIAGNLVRTGIGEGSAKQWLWILRNNHPYANWYVTRGLEDVFMTYTAIEALDPGAMIDMDIDYDEKWGTSFFHF